MDYEISLVDDQGTRLCTFIELRVSTHCINPTLDEIHPPELCSHPVYHAEHSTLPADYQWAGRSNIFGYNEGGDAAYKKEKLGCKTELLFREYALIKANFSYPLPKLMEQK